MRSDNSTTSKANVYFSRETSRIRARLREWTRQGRKHWDIHRYLWNPHVLYDATRLVVRNGGAGGLDGEGINAIRGHEWEVALSLGEELKTKRYKPWPVRRTYIPKVSGSLRPLGIPRVRDRIVQRALVILLECIYEQKFHEFSYGFRPNRRAVDCVGRVAETVFRYRYVLEADIEKFFEKLSHQKLMKLIELEVVDSRTLNLIREYLKVGFKEPGKPWQGLREGTPQGGPLSPLLANIYLHYVLDERFHEVFGNSSKVKMFRFADDFALVSRYRDQLEVARKLLSIWIHEADLKLKKEKTRVIDMSSRERSHDSKFDFLGFKIHLRSFKDNPKSYWVARQPSESSRKALRKRIREKVQPYLSEDRARILIEQIWRGWCGYFRYSNANRVMYRERISVRRLIWRYLKRKYRRTKKPVPFTKLAIKRTAMMVNIRPAKLIPNHLSQQGQQQTFNFGGA